MVLGICRVSKRGLTFEIHIRITFYVMDHIYIYMYVYTHVIHTYISIYRNTCMRVVMILYRMYIYI